MVDVLLLFVIWRNQTSAPGVLAVLPLAGHRSPLGVDTIDRSDTV